MPRRRALHLSIFALSVTAGLIVAPLSQAAEPTAEDRETARTLLLDGRGKYDAKDYTGALRAFAAAHAIMGVPTTGYDLARAQEALGMIVEARATALDIARIPQGPSEPEAFSNARASAADLAERLASRIPALLIAVSGPPTGAAIRVTLDGKVVPPASLSLPRKLNPGAHTVEASSTGFRLEQRRVEVKEGESLPVRIVLSPDQPSSLKKKEEGGLTSGQRSQRAPLWSFIAGGAGVVALGVGAGFAIDYANMRSTISSDCPNNICAKYSVGQAEEARARWNRDAGLFIGLGAAGLAGIGAGLFGILTLKRSETSEASKASETSEIRKQGQEAKEDKAASPRGASMRALPWLSSGGAGASITGAF